ncbi:Macrophage receptor MARCO [Fukomys damarensis]|uniref:Macrophage receptor MARCO n=1 Tax=Fukomys damarensis TaxID=885580 RepID=A0A091DSG5_FUKDA|nr:Macrophage receptor MARCO [Fukomys damarensis]
MESNETLKEEEFLESTEEGAAFNQTVFAEMETFIVDDLKPRKKNWVNCIMAVVIIYLILLTAGAVLLQLQVLKLQGAPDYFPNGTIIAEDNPSFSRLRLALELNDLQTQLSKVQVIQERLLQQVDNLTRNADHSNNYQLSPQTRIPGHSGGNGTSAKLLGGDCGTHLSLFSFVFSLDFPSSQSMFIEISVHQDPKGRKAAKVMEVPLAPKEKLVPREIKETWATQVRAVLGWQCSQGGRRDWASKFSAIVFAQCCRHPGHWVSPLLSR